MSLRALRLVVVALLSVALLAPSSASAQQGDEVYVDPDSPAEKEYALPTDKARRDADPTRRPGERIRKGVPTAPLFGVGVGSGSGTGAGKDRSTNPADGPRADSGRAGSADGAGRSRGAAGGAEASGLPGSDEVARLAASGATDGGATGTTLLVGGAGGAILLAGIAGGLVLRRRRA